MPWALKPVRIAFAVAALVPVNALAVSVKPMTSAQVVANADMIVVGTVVEISTRWTNQHRTMIATDYTLRLDQVGYDPDELFGPKTAGDTVVLSFAGGTVGKESVWVPGIPQFDLNEQVILFLDRAALDGISPLVGVDAGFYRVAAGAAGPIVVHGASGAPVSRTFFSSFDDKSAGFTLGEYMAEVQRALPIAKAKPELRAVQAFKIPDEIRHLVFTGDQIPKTTPVFGATALLDAHEPPQQDPTAPPSEPTPPERNFDDRGSEELTVRDAGSRYAFLWGPPNRPSVFNIPPVLYPGGWGDSFEYSLSDWNRYASDIFRKYITSDNFFGHQERNDFAFTDRPGFQGVYGFSVPVGILGIAVMYNSSGDTIGDGQQIYESDVILFTENTWTLDWNTGYNNTNIWFFASTVIHEIGHTFGREHQFTEVGSATWHSVMNYPPSGALDTEFWLPFVDDAGSIRAAYPGQTVAIDDLGVHLFYTNGNSIPPIPVFWSTFPASVSAGGSFTMVNFVIENLGTSAMTPAINWWLTPAQQSYAGALYCSSSSFSSLGVFSFFTADRTVNVPASVQPGDYYIAAALSSDDYDWNQSAWSNTPITVTGESDLIISASSLTPTGGVNPGDTINLADTVRNDGSGEANSSFWSTWYISTDNNVTTGDYMWAFRRVNCCLDAGASNSDSLTPSWPDLAPYNTPGSTYYIKAMADDMQEVAESNENNNWGTLKTVTLTSGCTIHDMNDDGFVSIIGDVPCFVDCIYFGNCTCCGSLCTCAGDCNCDGFTSIIGDVPCFVDCVYFGTCAGCGRSGDSGAAGGGFTIGGVVYQDQNNPLVSGVWEVRVDLLDADDRLVGSTTTNGLMGIWRIDNVPEGAHTVVFGSAADVPGQRDSIEIAVSAANEAANQSITLLQTPEASQPEESQNAAATAKTERSRSK